MNFIQLHHDDFSYPVRLQLTVDRVGHNVVEEYDRLASWILRLHLPKVNESVPKLVLRLNLKIGHQALDNYIYCFVTV